MAQDNSNIDQLFKDSFSDYKPRRNDFSFVEIDSKLSKSAFFSFRLSSFNIYYASAIVATLILSTYLTAGTLFTTQSKHVNEERNEQQHTHEIYEEPGDAAEESSKINLPENENKVKISPAVPDVTVKESIERNIDHTSAESTEVIHDEKNKETEKPDISSTPLDIENEEIEEDSVTIIKTEDVIIRDTFEVIIPGSRGSNRKNR